MIEEDNERMDIIGQNGNDGLHYDLEEDENQKKVLVKVIIDLNFSYLQVKLFSFYNFVLSNFQHKYIL